jgi:hypothetical protein
MARRSASNLGEGSPAEKKKASDSVRLVADNSATPDGIAPAADDSAPLTLDAAPRAERRPTAKRLAHPIVSEAAASKSAASAKSSTPERASIPAAHARPPRDRRRVAAGAVAVICVGGALVAGGVWAVGARHHRLTSVAPAALHAATAPEAKPILADYTPPNRDQVRRAYLSVAATYHVEGLSGVVRNTMDCFSALAQTPSYPGLDYCIAMDAYGEALQRKLDNGQPLANDSYYTSTTPRELAAARGVVSADGDPGARVLDVRRLAGEVSQDDPADTAQVVADNDKAPGAATLRAASDAAPQVIPSETPPGAPASRLAPQPVLPAQPAAARTTVAQNTAVAPAVVQTAHASRTPAPHVATVRPTPQVVRAQVTTRTPTRAPTRATLAPARPQRIAAQHVVQHVSPPVVRASTHTVRPLPRSQAHLQKASVVSTHRSTPGARLAHTPAHDGSLHARLNKIVAAVKHAFAPPPSRHVSLDRTPSHAGRDSEHGRVTHASASTSHGTSLRKTAKGVTTASYDRDSRTHARPRDWNEDHTPAKPVRVAARTRVTHDPDRDRYDAMERRAAEPSEWVDCRHPRGAGEVRMCEGPTAAGGGTLGGQYAGNRGGRYR